MSVFYVPASSEMLVNMQSTAYSKVELHEKETSDFIDTHRVWKSEYRKSEYICNGFGRTVLPDDTYDVCVPVMGAAYLKLNNIKMCLVNPHNKSSAMPASYRDAGLQVIADSGGFQLVTNKLDFIDPVELAKSYNSVATLGMDLDIPPRRGLPLELTLALARVQNANYEAISEHLNSKVSMVTILHGGDIDAAKRWMDVIGREDSQFISVAGLLRMETDTIPVELRAIERILLAVSRYKHTKYVHCLGSTSTMASFIYGLLDHLRIVKNIGGDSVSHVLNIASGQLFSLYPWTNVKVPKNFHTTVLPSCSCPICSTLHDYRLLNGYPGKAHALYNRNEQKNYIVHLTNLLLEGDIKIPEFLSLTNLTTSPDVIQMCIDYASEFKATGKFRELKRKKSKLFTRNTKPQASKEVIDRIKFIINNYEKYYQTRFL